MNAYWVHSTYGQPNGLFIYRQGSNLEVNALYIGQLRAVGTTEVDLEWRICIRYPQHTDVLRPEAGPEEENRDHCSGIKTLSATTESKRNTRVVYQTDRQTD